MKNQSQKTHGMTAEGFAAEMPSPNTPMEPIATETAQRADAQVRLLGILADAVVESFRTDGSDSR